MQYINIGMLAHVDAGKTTLSEALLYVAGITRKMGRVDHKNSLLDTHQIERERGITIFSKQAIIKLDHMQITLLDTPGHVDFSAETERTLSVLDYAILVIDSTAGIQSHTLTLWKWLASYHIPVFIFFNKIDIDYVNKQECFQSWKQQLGDTLIDFSLNESQLQDEIAMSDECVFQSYMHTSKISDDIIRQLIAKRKIVPCFWGSALKQFGIAEFLKSLQHLIQMPQYPSSFSAIVYKVMRDIKKQRLTFLKCTGGSLSVKDSISYADISEKINEIRIYSGEQYQSVKQIHEGQIVAVTGLTNSIAGMQLGDIQTHITKKAIPLFQYTVSLSEENKIKALQILQHFTEEDPNIQFYWDEYRQAIQVSLMGEVQKEVLENRLQEEVKISATLEKSDVIYQETITSTVLGIGHFEPLRHYAEVQLRLEPAERGSGILVSSECSTELLPMNLQHLILNHIKTTCYTGTLMGAHITDIHIILVAGKSHEKHTEGGDLQEATNRAIRQGLMQADMLLLEPYETFTIEIPNVSLGKVLHDLEMQKAIVHTPTIHGESAIIHGKVPLSTFQDYAKELKGDTSGFGKLESEFSGYDICHNTQEVIQKYKYSVVDDRKFIADSIFCKHGAGFNVSWTDVFQHAHVRTEIDKMKKNQDSKNSVWNHSGIASHIEDDDLLQIWEKTYGPIKDRTLENQKKYTENQIASDDFLYSRIQQDDYLLVDGYNMIFSWAELKNIQDLDLARRILIDKLSNFSAMRHCHTILVFDAYRVKGNLGTMHKQYGIHIVYTKESQTADAYIEQASYDLSKNHRVRVATSDSLEQLIIFGHGSERISANELYLEVQQAEEQLKSIIQNR